MIQPSLTWDGTQGAIQGTQRRNTLKSKPTITGFAFDTLYFEPAYGNMFKVVQGSTLKLTEEETNIIEDFISTYKFKILAVDAKGGFLGEVDDTDPRVSEVVSVAPPNDDHWYWHEGTWKYVYGVDANGNSLGNVSIYDCEQVATSYPPNIYSKWKDGEWVDGRTIEQLRKQAANEIDSIAGDIRSSYITIAPGQEAVYILKGQQAKAFKDSGYTNPEKYVLITAEAQVMGITPVELAEQVLTLEDLWLQAAAAIEATRLSGKALLKTASNAEALQGVVRETTTNLLALKNPWAD